MYLLTSYLFLVCYLWFASLQAQQIGLVIDSVNTTDGSGLQLEYADGVGIRVKSTGGVGLFIGTAGSDGVRVQNAGNDAIHVARAWRYGLFINNTLNDAIHVASAGGYGLFINNTRNDGIHITSVGNDGIEIVDALYGIYIRDIDQRGIWVRNAGTDGIQVDDAGDDGIHVVRATNYSMNIQGDKTLSGGPEAHIAQIYNRGGAGADVLALKIGQTANPLSGNNFITFYKGDNAGVGRIEGNGSGGVLYGTSGSDFAECLPRLSAEDTIEDGDIIGVLEGAISHNTSAAIQLMVITDRPAVLGNQGADEELLDEMVSFIGQVPVKVVGPVQQGDWIIPSGEHDGVGLAVSPDKLMLEHRIVCQAWETNLTNELKKVNCAVGLDQSKAKDVILSNMQDQIQDLQSQILEMKSNTYKGKPKP